MWIQIISPSETAGVMMETASKRIMNEYGCDFRWPRFFSYLMRCLQVHLCVPWIENHTGIRLERFAIQLVLCVT